MIQEDSPWAFLTKPRHVTYLEKLSKELWRTRTRLPVLKGFSTEEVDQLWGYCLDRGLVKVEDGWVEGSEAPWVKVTKYIISQTGNELIEAYQNEPNGNRRRRR